MTAITPARVRALAFIKKTQPVGQFPKLGPPLWMVRELVRDNYVEECGKEPGALGFTLHKLTPKGEDALEKAIENYAKSED